MMNINWTHPVIFDNPNMDQHLKTHWERGWKMLKIPKKELVFSAIGALENTLKTMGVFGRMSREIKECKKC